MKLVECVPNFSEGRDLQILDQIAAAIKAVKNVTLLDMDPGADTNRTVFTMVGEPSAVVEAAFEAIKKAAELIDMSKHTGAHPRMGATDVCPFIPVANMSMDECIALSHALGKRVGEELNIPVYLYEYAATKSEWQNLAEVRKGEYEAIAEKMKDEYWQPNYGPRSFNAKSGATAIGAREFLIAYNINLNTRDKKKAHDIALSIREKGRKTRDAKAKLVKDENGKAMLTPGLFKNCKAVGWVIPEYDRAQISINLTNYKVTPPHLVLEKVRELAMEKGIQVTGSELVGLIPKEAIIQSGTYYLERLGESAGVPEEMIIGSAVQSMGLDDLAVFDIDKKVIEYAIKRDGLLVDLSIREFTNELSTDSMAPGGGSVAALCSAIAGGLAAMVANLTVNKKGYEAVTPEAMLIAKEAQLIKDRSFMAIDADTDVFYEMMDARKLPKKTAEEQSNRDYAIQKATKRAIMVPMESLRIAFAACDLAERVAKIGNKNALSDAGVAAICANSAAKAAFLNIKINMPDINDEAWVKVTMTNASDLVTKTNYKALAVENSVLESL